ncbi:hypothetical protein NDU88_003786 [Pleurodeles waltl]|uniref:Uncharacterized protein n=1 Tax=Pleurodeles waltl TaxID=8319 RepID=A0AAV7RF85_PLEWA|nr:hypothetical protein NDU88_003786 [Pleurodeles waltl]
MSRRDFGLLVYWKQGIVPRTSQPKGRANQTGGAEWKAQECGREDTGPVEVRSQQREDTVPVDDARRKKEGMEPKQRTQEGKRIPGSDGVYPGVLWRHKEVICWDDAGAEWKAQECGREDTGPVEVRSQQREDTVPVDAARRKKEGTEPKQRTQEGKRIPGSDGVYPGGLWRHKVDEMGRARDWRRLHTYKKANNKEH